MQCEDLDLSKSGQISQVGQQMQEINFSITKIFLQNLQTLQKQLGFDQPIPTDGESQMIPLSLKFYSAVSNCKLKQKLTKVSILQNVSIQKRSCFLVLEKDAINLKISFPINEEHQIFGKVYVYNQRKLLGQQQMKKPGKLFGTFCINLLQWTKEMKKESKFNESQNPESLTNVKKVPLKVLSEQNKYIEKIKQSKSQFTSVFLREQQSQAIQNNQNVPYLYKFAPNTNQVVQQKAQTPNQSFIEFRILPPQTVQSIINGFSLENKNNLALKQYKLKIVSSIVNEKIVKQHKSINTFISSRHSRFFILPQRQILNNISRARSEAIFKPIFEDNQNEVPLIPVVNEPLIKANSKPFKQKIYELLQEVKLLKKGIQMQRKSLARNSSISRVKNIFCLIGLNRHQSPSPNNLRIIHQNFLSSQRTEQVGTDFMMPLSSVLRKSSSQIKFSLKDGMAQITSTNNAKNQRISRIEKRLQSYEHMRNLLCLNSLQNKLNTSTQERQIENFKVNSSQEFNNFY